MTGSGTEDLLRDLAPRALGAVVRRYGAFSRAEDAVQEALLAAHVQWARDGVPDDPLAWVVRVASRRLIDEFRRDDVRRLREDQVVAWSLRRPDPVSGDDDSLLLLYMCCHPSLAPSSAIPLALRAVGGLTTREIAAAFLVPETTMAQRISRAKAKVETSGVPFAPPSPEDRDARLQSVLHVLYLMFNEAYVGTTGPELGRTDLAEEAIRLARAVHASLPGDTEVAGLVALMLLTHARRAARTGPDGGLVPLAEQDRRSWDRAAIGEGVGILTVALRRGRLGEYQLQAAIAAVHDQAPTYADTNWDELVRLYDRLAHVTANPMVALNRAVAVAMRDGPDAGLALLDGLDEALADHHRLHSVRAHLLERVGDRDGARAEFRAAAARTTNVKERDFLTLQAARLGAERR